MNNYTDRPVDLCIDSAQSLVEILQLRAELEAQQCAYTFLTDGEQRAEAISYHELDKRARSIAAALQGMKLQGERALLLYPPGLEYITAFFACLYAGVIAVPAYPPSNKRHLPRLQSILQDSRAAVILSCSGPAETLFGDRHKLPTLYTDTLDDASDAWRAHRPGGGDIAFLQYTSGSTGTPKGVMVSHANLLANQKIIKAGFGHDRNSTVVGWLPLYHDMGLIGNVMQPLYIGATAILMPPMAFLEKPLRWLQAVSKYRAYTSGGPNFAFELCAEKITEQDKAQLDLSHWKLAFNGAEPIRPATLDRFEQAFASCGFRREAFYPCYGLAEATLLASGAIERTTPTITSFDADSLQQQMARPPQDGNSIRDLVGCGIAGAGHSIRIASPDSGLPCMDGEIGEIRISGPSVTLGYWQNTAASEALFTNDGGGDGAGRWLRSGDLGFIHDGELFVSGRLKDLIIVRGRNYYPQDIEFAAEKAVDSITPGVAAAFSVTGEQGEKLALMLELKRSQVRRGDYSADFAAIRNRLIEECGIAADIIMLLKPGALLKTSSGKIRRSACREAFEEDRFQAVAVDPPRQSGQPSKTAVKGAEIDAMPSLSREMLLAAPDDDARRLLAGHLAGRAAALLELPSERIDTETPLTHYGIDSLRAAELKYEADSLLAIGLPGVLFLEDKSLSQIAAAALEQARREPLAPAPEQIEVQGKEMPLSYGQLALWTTCRANPDSIAYHLPVLMHFHCPLDSRVLAEALHILVGRHPQLRSVFKLNERRQAVQIIGPQQSILERVGIASIDESRAILAAEMRKPFDLERGPLLRTLLIDIGETEQLLLFCAHHLVADLRSLTVLLDELRSLYAAGLVGQPMQLPPLPSDYGAFVNWQQSYLNSDAAEQAWQYWRQQLSGELPQLQLPAGHIRQTATQRGGAETLHIDAASAQALRALAERHGTTLYTVLLTLFKSQLFRYSGQNDFIVGSPISGRPKSEFAGLAGYFVNPVALRTRPEARKSFEQYLCEVKQTVLDALRYQDYPQALIAEKLRPARRAGLSPFYRVWFALQGDAGGKHDAAALALGLSGVDLHWPGMQATSSKLPEIPAQFDLGLMVAAVDEGLAASFQYDCGVFERSTVLRMLGHFQCLLRAIVADSGQCLGDPPLLTVAERKRQLYDWNATFVDYPQDPCLPDLFAKQVEATPEATALVYEDVSLTYAQLHEKSARLARILQGLGVGPDAPVGICMERSPDMVIGLLGILIAGGAYVPLDPDLPRDRLAFMLEEVGAALLLTQTRLRESLELPVAHTLCLDAEWPEAAETGKTPAALHPGHLAYCIYTSGSTGRPKGVGVPHRGIVNRLLWMQDQYKLDSTDRVLQKTPYGFDVSVWEFFWPLITGATLVVAPPEQHKDSRALIATIIRQAITTIHFVPSMLQVFLDTMGVEQCASLQRVICSGEALPAESVGRFHRKLAAGLHNLYGPTEASVDVTFRACEPQNQDTAIPIGRPIANSTIYILDSQGNPVPVGVAGELHIGGVGLARGYVNRPELTAEKFVPDPYGAPGSRLYRTGDLVRYRDDGVIDYLGRIDHQVKIRGFRIELGEIESSLRSHPAVKESVVLLRADQPGQPRLAAYILSEDGAAVALDELKAMLAGKLPDYMVPTDFVVLPEWPLSVNGKLDRAALPSPEPGVASEQAFVAPRDEAEEAFAEIWRQVLGVERLSIHDDFFELGGHSLSAVQIAARIQESYDLDVPIKLIFEAPNIAEFVDKVAEYQES